MGVGALLAWPKRPASKKPQPTSKMPPRPSGSPPKRAPTLNSLSTLAIYEYFAGDFAAGDKAAEQAEAKATSKAEAKEHRKTAG